MGLRLAQVSAQATSLQKAAVGAIIRPGRCMFSMQAPAASHLRSPSPGYACRACGPAAARRATAFKHPVCMHASSTETLEGFLSPALGDACYACMPAAASPCQHPLHFCAVGAHVRHSILLTVRQDATKQQGRCGSRVQVGAAHHSCKGGGVGREARVRCRAHRTACQTCADLSWGCAQDRPKLRWERMCSRSP